ncbi:MAG: hypothetical protein HRU34_08980 [Richelia sp.]|nr:hypothetical protein [Richelia sp.]CDN12148.1 hypothetical protein RintRC_2377 [Richelia intracellularis]
MNYQKLDASLAMAIKDAPEPETPNFVVFIHTHSPLEPDAIAILRNTTLNNIIEGEKIFTATISLNSISQLSEQTWVKYLNLSRKLSLVN